MIGLSDAFLFYVKIKIVFAFVGAAHRAAPTKANKYCRKAPKNHRFGPNNIRPLQISACTCRGSISCCPPLAGFSDSPFSISQSEFQNTIRHEPATLQITTPPCKPQTPSPRQFPWHRLCKTASSSVPLLPCEIQPLPRGRARIAGQIR